LDLNFDIFTILSKCFRLKLDYTTTTEYFHEADTAVITDFRSLVNGKKDLSVFESYTQVFDDKHGFINNLSVLDLLFNEGKYALDYLKQQKI
jgi:hypothetical protein